MSFRRLTVRQRAIGAWLVVCVVWGTTYLGIRVALETMPPFIMAGLRWTIAGLAIVAGLHRAGRRLPDRRLWTSLGVTGFLLLVVGNGGVVWAEQYVPSGLTAVIIASTPFWMVGTEALFGGDRVRGGTLLGLTVGFMGIVLLVWPELASGGTSGRRFLAGVIALQIAEVGWALGSSRSKRHMAGVDVLAATAVQMLIAGIVLLGIGTLMGEWGSLHFSVRSTSALVYLMLVGSIGAYAAYGYALKHLPVALVSLYAYINPIIAVVLGILLLGEPFDARMGLAAAIVLAGVAIVQRPTSQKARDTADEHAA